MSESYTEPGTIVNLSLFQTVPKDRAVCACQFKQYLGNVQRAAVAEDRDCSAVVSSEEAGSSMVRITQQRSEAEVQEDGTGMSPASSSTGSASHRSGRSR